MQDRRATRPCIPHRLAGVEQFNLSAEVNVSRQFAVLFGAVAALFGMCLSAQQPASPLTGFKDASAPLLFREDWKHDYAGPREGPIGQKHVGHADLELKLYGDPVNVNPRGGIWENQTGPNDPPHTFTGSCRNACALTLRHRKSNLDLTGNAKFKWRTRISRLRYLHPIIKLADGRAFIGDYAETFRANNDYIEAEMNFAEINWLTFDLNQLQVGGDHSFVKIDLSKVDEIGFTDLAPGSPEGKGAGARANVDWIEVYGKAVPR
jgi:hypothetical protein